MAGIITHLCIADKVSSILGDKIKDAAAFFVGNVAPDCIHARENYERSMKKHTHLRDGISDKDFLISENLALFESRLNSFVSRYCTLKPKDLYLGYLSHLIIDELFIKTVRAFFVKKMEDENINQSDSEFFNRIMFDIDQNDFYLVKNYPFKNNPIKMLDGIRNFEVKDYLKASEINASKGWIIWRYFDIENECKKPVYISYSRMIDFIDRAAVNIIDRFDKYGL